MATAADILAVRKEARLRQYEYFDNVSGSKIQFIKQQPPLSVISLTKYNTVSKVTTTLADSTDYAFDGYRTITLVANATETDVYKADVGTTVTDSEVSDITDYSKEEVYGHLRLFYSSIDLDTSTYVAELYKKLAAGYLIMKYWEGYPQGNDFWKHGRNLVDDAHARIDDIKNGEIQLTSNATTRINKEIYPFQYKIIDSAPGLMPSEIYSETAESTDYEEY
jgi:hypothetical protein